MRMQRAHKFSHIVSTLVQDKSTGKYQSFSRGEVKVIFNDCSGKYLNLTSLDYWNGEKVLPLTKKVKSYIKDILF